MDYLELPRKLIYKDRDNLKDFGVHILGTINYQLFTHMKEMSIMCMEGAMDFALQCFNNAYYICTIIQLEDFPELRVADYEKKLLEKEIPYRELICTTSMAMVCDLLAAYDNKWKNKDNDLIKNIHFRFTHYHWLHTGARDCFEKMVDRCESYGFILPKSVLAPRDIIEVINA